MKAGKVPKVAGFFNNMKMLWDGIKIGIWKVSLCVSDSAARYFFGGFGS